MDLNPKNPSVETMPKDPSRPVTGALPNPVYPEVADGNDNESSEN